MDTKYNLLKSDYWIQKVLGIAILACCVTIYGIFIGLLGLIVFGGIQVLSALIFVIAFQDRKRIVYLCVVALFFLLLYARSEMPYGQYEIATHFINALLCITPIALGLLYFQLTAKEYKERKHDIGEQYLTDEELLDA